MHLYIAYRYEKGGVVYDADAILHGVMRPNSIDEIKLVKGWLAKEKNVKDVVITYIYPLPNP